MISQTSKVLSLNEIFHDVAPLEVDFSFQERRARDRMTFFKSCHILERLKSSKGSLLLDHQPARKRFSRRLKDHLRSIEARMRKLLKGPRHYDLKIGDFQDKFYAGNDQPGRMKCSSIEKNKVKVKDLKPKRIKDYLECKNNQRSPALLKKSAQAGPVVSGRDIPFVIQLKQIIEAPR
ncbi:hypothetical protein GQ457_06G009180 [Hibiscus cannabinus]